MSRNGPESILLDIATLREDRHPMRALRLAELAGIEDARDLPLGTRDNALLSLWGQWFGTELPCLDTCPECGQSVEFDLPLSMFSAEPSAETREGWRALTTADRLSVATLPAEKARAELARAVTGREVAAEEIAQVEDWLDRADPMARLTIHLTCAHCGTAWESPFDIVRHLWTAFRNAGQRLLHDIHMLARAYHWSEAEILSLPANRRRAYLELIGT